MVREGQVIIVDEFTGRLMYGRRYGEGLHQAIEAKEKRADRAGEPDHRHHHPSELLPPLRQAGRHDRHRQDRGAGVHQDLRAAGGGDPHQPADDPPRPRRCVYKTEEAKFRGIVGEILQLQSRGQPTLVGTRSIEVSERLSERLKADKLQLAGAAAAPGVGLLEAEKLEQAQKRELARALQAAPAEVQREVQHLEQAVSKFEYTTQRLVQPEEQRRVEQRLAKLSRLAEEIDAADRAAERQRGTEQARSAAHGRDHLLPTAGGDPPGTARRRCCGHSAWTRT